MSDQNFPLPIEEKEEHPDKLQLLKDVLSKYYYSVEEIQTVINGVNYLGVLTLGFDNRIEGLESNYVGLASGNGRGYSLLSEAITAIGTPTEAGIPFYIHNDGGNYNANTNPNGKNGTYLTSTTSPYYVRTGDWLMSTTLIGSGIQDLPTSDAVYEYIKPQIDQITINKALPHTSSPFNLAVNSSYFWYEEAFPEIYLKGTKTSGSTYHIPIVEKDATEIVIDFYRHDGTSWVSSDRPSRITISEGINDDKLIKMSSEGADFSVEFLVNPSKIPVGNVSGNVSVKIEDRCWVKDYSYIQRINDIELLDITSMLPVTDKYYLTATSTEGNSAFEIINKFKLPKIGKLKLTIDANAGDYELIQYLNFAGKVIESITADGTDYKEFELSPTIEGVEYVQFSRNKGNRIQVHATKEAYLSVLFESNDLTNTNGLFQEEIKWNDGFYLNDDGEEDGSGAWATSDFIQLKEFFYVEGVFNGGSVVNHIAYYNDSKEPIALVDGSSEYIAKFDKKTPPSNNYYIKLCTQVANKATVKLFLQSKEALHRTKNIESLKLIDITNVVNIIKGIYISTLKYYGNSGGWNVAKFIKLIPSEDYFLTLNVQSGNYFVYVFYDINYRPISGVSTTSALGTYMLNRYKIEPPTGARFMEISIGNSQIPTFKLEASYKALFSEAQSTDVTDYITGVVMPSYIDMAEGHQCNIFLKNITLQDDARLIVKDYTPMTKRKRHLQITPSVGEADFTATFNQVDKKLRILEEKETTFRTSSTNTGSGETIYVMICGDSLVDNNFLATEVYRLLDLDGDYNIVQVGTRGPVGGKHEGRGSWRWEDYIENEDHAGKNNAFLYSGILDFSQYCIDNGYPRIDLAIIALGTNDVTQGYEVLYNDKENEIIDYSKQFIDALTADFPNCKIGIGLPAIGSPDFTGGDDAVFKYSINKLNSRYIKVYDDGAYNSNVTTIFDGAWVDTENSYKVDSLPISDRITTEEEDHYDSVHGAELYYYQRADAYYAKIRAWLDNKL